MSGRASNPLQGKSLTSQVKQSLDTHFAAVCGKLKTAAILRQFALTQPHAGLVDALVEVSVADSDRVSVVVDQRELEKLIAKRRRTWSSVKPEIQATRVQREVVNRFAIELCFASEGGRLSSSNELRQLEQTLQSKIGEQSFTQIAQYIRGFFLAKSAGGLLQDYSGFFQISAPLFLQDTFLLQAFQARISSSPAGIRQARALRDNPDIRLAREWISETEKVACWENRTAAVVELRCAVLPRKWA